MQKNRIYELTEFGKLCRGARMRFHMTRPELAKKLGVTNEQISQIEAGRMRPDDAYICKITGTLALSSEEVADALRKSHDQYLPANVIPFGSRL